jgi:hypothetical protein
LIWIKARAGCAVNGCRGNGGDMAEIMIKCPATSHAISTGVAVDSDASFNALLDVAYHVDCPLCGGNHVWFKHDAWIAERPESLQVGSDTAGRSKAQ